MASPGQPLRRRLLTVAVVCVGLGIAAPLIGWHPGIGMVLLLLGIVYAVAVLVLDWRQRS